MSNEGIWYPKGGLKSFCDRLMTGVTTQADSRTTGTLKLGTEVKKIRVENGKVVGIMLADGTLIDSSFVISNADYKATFLKLLGQVFPRMV